MNRLIESQFFHSFSGQTKQHTDMKSDSTLPLDVNPQPSWEFRLRSAWWFCKAIPLAHICLYLVILPRIFVCLLFLIAAGKQQQQCWESLVFVLLLAVFFWHWRCAVESPELPGHSQTASILFWASLLNHTHTQVFSGCFLLLCSPSFLRLPPHYYRSHPCRTPEHIYRLLFQLFDSRFHWRAAGSWGVLWYVLFISFRLLMDTVWNYCIDCAEVASIEQTVLIEFWGWHLSALHKSCVN